MKRQRERDAESAPSDAQHMNWLCVCVAHGKYAIISRFFNMEIKHAIKFRFSISKAFASHYRLLKIQYFK